MKNKDITMIVLAVLLILSIGYIGYSQYQKRNTLIFQQGGRQGYQFAISQIVKGVSSCQEVPLIFNNKTINVVAVSCLKPQNNKTPTTK